MVRWGIVSPILRKLVEIFLAPESFFFQDDKLRPICSFMELFYSLHLSKKILRQWGALSQASISSVSPHPHLPSRLSEQIHRCLASSSSYLWDRGYKRRSASLYLSSLSTTTPHIVYSVSSSSLCSSSPIYAYLYQLLVSFYTLES